MSLTAGAGTRCMSLLSSSPSLWDLVDERTSLGTRTGTGDGIPSLTYRLSINYFWKVRQAVSVPGIDVHLLGSSSKY